MIMKQLLFLSLFAMLLSCEIEDPTEPGLLVPRTVDEDTSLPSVSINGTQFHAETFGYTADPMIVLLHGGPGGDYRSMLNAKAFADDGFFVLFYDQRGTGLSKREGESQFTDTPVQLMIDDLDALIAHYRVDNAQKVFLMGHSWGAMLATAYINQFPHKIAGAVLAEPGGLTWTQTEEYLSRSNKIELFSEALNDAIYPEQIFAGIEKHEMLDYKASFFSTFENAPGNTIGNAGPYPFWRNGAVSFNVMIDYAEENGFDFTTHLSQFEPDVLFMYSELNKAYGSVWAQTVASVYPHVELMEVKGTGHEILYFGWDDFYSKALTYLNGLK
jgi:proline iminopeptidase